MSRPAFAAAVASLLAAIAILILNLREKDNYEGGSLEPPRGDNVPPEDGTLRRIVPETISHPCPVCGDCTHPVEMLRNFRELSIRDHDEWYRLFWAGDEIYHYDDPPLFAASLRNSTARDPRGTWAIRARLGPPTHGAVPQHACTPAPSEFEIKYELVVSTDHIEPGPPVRAGAFLSFPSAIDWFSFYPDRSHMPYVLRFGWRLAGPPSVAEAGCSCANR